MDKLLWILISLQILRRILPYLLCMLGGLVLYGMVATSLPNGQAFLVTAVVTAGIMSGLRGQPLKSGHRSRHRPPRMRNRNPSR